MVDIYEEAVNELQAAVKEQLTFVNEELKNTYIAFLGVLRVEVRLYYLNRELALTTLWKRLRDDDELLHLHLNITGEWVARVLGRFVVEDYSSSTSLYKTLCEFIAVSISNNSVGSNAARNEQRDVEFYSKTTSSAELTELFISEKWLVALVLMIRHLGRLTQTP